MLETEAKEKLCPFKLTSYDAARSIHDFFCDGLRCMGWDEWTRPVYDKPEGEFGRNVTGHEPMDPPKGHCGMKPPESNCMYP